LKADQLKTKSPLSSSEVPDAVAKRLFDLYTVSSSSGGSGSKGSRSMPRRLKDKLAAHMMILALHIDDFSTSLHAFQKDLKFSVQRLMDFYRALGCFVRNQISTMNGKKVVIKKAELTLPLNIANQMEPKKKTRKNI
jgi:hypothetical protein